MRQQQMTRLIHSLPQLTHHQRQQLASSLQALLCFATYNLVRMGSIGGWWDAHHA